MAGNFTKRLVISVGLILAVTLSVSAINVPGLFASSKPAILNPLAKSPDPLATSPNDTKAVPDPIGTDFASADQPPKLETKDRKQTAEEIKNKKRVKEINELRTSNTKTYLNEDGSKTMAFSLTPKHYKDEDDKWAPIETIYEEDRSYTNQKPISGVMKFFEPKAFSLETADLKVTYKPFLEGITYTYGEKTFTLTPNSGRNVLPEKVTKDTITRIIYSDVWDGIDVEYVAEGGSIKENVIIKKASAITSYSFSLKGSTFSAHPTEKDAIALDGIDPNNFYLSQLVVFVNERGYISEQPVKQSFTKNTLTVNIDPDWLDSLKKSNFPVIIDPSFVNNVGGSLGNFITYKSDGYVCPNSVCTPQAGGLNDNGWKNWRMLFRIPFDQLQGKTLLGSAVGLDQRTDLYGNTANKWFGMSWGTSASYNCRHDPSSQSGVVGTATWLENTNTIDWMMNNNQYAGWMCMWGEENNTFNYKQFYSQTLEMYVEYDTPTPMAMPVIPTDKEVLVTSQPSLRVNPVVDGDGDAVRYYFRVTDSPDAETGAVINSGWVPDSKWTIPDNVLKDGQTYYWHTYSGGILQTNPNWVRSFKVDMRTGRDSTQAYEDVGPIGVSLATGNVTTGAGSHSISALGGPIGVSLDYNSPAASRPGLVGQYWNNTTPTGSPLITKVDQEIDYNWGTGSPVPNVINVNNFFVRWDGFVTAPVTGNYKFGCAGDEWCSIFLNGQTYFTGPQNWGAVNIALEAGKPVPLRFEYVDTSGGAATVFKVKGAVDEQIVPLSWLQTSPRNTATEYGLTGRYYTDDGSNAFPSNSADPNRFLMARRDAAVNFNWGDGAPAPSMPADNFLVKWLGFLTVPTTGSYKLGAYADHGIGIHLGTGSGGALQLKYDGWLTNTPNVRWGTASTLTAGQQIPIMIDYRESGGKANINLLIEGPGFAAQSVPVTWLSPGNNSVPGGWTLGVGDGDVRFERLKVNNTSVVLSDSTGATYEYKWENNAYKPPVDEEAVVSKNADNTFTVIDVDGKTYIFDLEGKLTSVTSPADDRKPVALKYEYSGNPVRLTKITDGVTSARNGTLHYSGDSQCSVSSGFDAVPSGMLCAFKTTDGKTTRFQYKAGNLSRIEQPGSANVDYGYDSLARIVSYRDTLANDAITASVRTDDVNATTSVAYDEVGRVSTITSPAPTASGSRLENKVAYFPGKTELHLTGASEPNGFSRQIEYDNLLRTTKTTDLTGQSVLTEWHPEKDFIFSSTDPTGLKSTTIYDSNDLPIDNYGPAPAAWFGTDRKPLSTYVNDVPHTSTAYDEGLTGLGVSYYDNKKLLREPKLNATVIWPTNVNVVSAFVSGSAPVTPTDGWGARYKGKIKLDAVGNYNFKLRGDAGFRLFIDDQLVVDGWGGGTLSGGDNTVASATPFVNAAAGSTHRIRVDHYHGASGATSLQLYMTPPGQSETSVVSALLSPDYGLTTSSIIYDSVLGDLITKTTYLHPEYGIVDKVTNDFGGLNLENSATYETPGIAFLRQLSKTLPGGATTNYEYYGASDTRDDPCTPATESYNQAGFIKFKTEPDPDGGGSGTGRKSEVVYDESGATVASRIGSDPWTCFGYDSRGRSATTVIPTIGSMPGRTITNDYAVGGNPLKLSSADSSGTITVESDLLGRTIKYTDSLGKVTTNTFDAIGRLTSRNSIIGLEEYTYDSFDRLSVYKLDSVTYATISYDSYSRVTSVAYPSGMSLSSISRDGLQRESGVTFTLPDSSTVSDSVVYSSSGSVVSGIENGVSKTYTYDSARRLTGAVIGSDSFGYEFGAPDSSCSSLPGNNANTSKSSNRTKLTINSQVTTYCYDQADRLLESSDSAIGEAQYDDHGNTTQLGVTGQTTEFTYDAGDRNIGISQVVGGVETSIDYVRDVTGRLVEHTKKTDDILDEEVSYGYIGAGDGAAFLLDSAGVVKQKYVSLPGDILLTIKPGASSPNEKTYSLTNIHGDVMATIDSTGVLISHHISGPFGESIVSSSNPANTATDTSWGYLGQHQKTQETALLLSPTQMGARVYIPSLGRFLQVDPVEGGTENNYTYPQDPVNDSDVTGLAGLRCICPAQRGKQGGQGPKLSAAEQQELTRKAQGLPPKDKKTLNSAESKKNANEKYSGDRGSRQSKDKKTKSEKGKDARGFVSIPYRKIFGSAFKGAAIAVVVAGIVVIGTATAPVWVPVAAGYVVITSIPLGPPQYAERKGQMST